MPALKMNGTEEIAEDDAEKLNEIQIKEMSSENLISKPFRSANCTIPEDILEFNYSFGYDCLRHFNLCVINKINLIYMSGNIIHFYNTETFERTFRRSAGGGGLGHVTVHPKLPHVAVAENGVWPLLIIYEWPSFSIVSVLQEGTEREYLHINYSPDGELLLSAGGEPDYQVTIWDWRKSTILLRGKSYGQDIINAKFSDYIYGHLTTSGYGHIKFWEMVDTFTGLKIKGALGRFGKTEICDIIGFLALPDERVISGCAWGNMLLWEDGLIKVEVCRKKRYPCHDKPITQFIFENGELTTIGLDGKIKLWFFETIDLADPPEDDRFIEMEPMFEFEFGEEFNDVSLMCIEKMLPGKHDDYFWYAQDANGGIWKLDLNVNQANLPPERLFMCHAGPVMDMATSPCSSHIATLGLDGQLFFYNYGTKVLLMGEKFPSEGRCLLWLPVQVVESGNVLIAGFSDGIIRVVVASLLEKESDADTEDFITLIQIVKPHSKPVTALSINSSGTLVVSGSEDRTVFVHGVVPEGQFISLVSLYFVDVPNSVTYLEWKPDVNYTFLASCTRGYVVEIHLPDRMEFSTEKSYKLENLEKHETVFSSMKSQIRRDILLKKLAAEKEKKLARKREELRLLREENPAIDIDEETYLADSDEEEELEPLYFPPEPNPVLFASYLKPDIIWLSVGGYDSGYMYQYKVGSSVPLQATMVADADDIEINTFVYSPDRKYLIFGMQDGKIRVNRINEDDPSDLSNYWLYSMHDNLKGIIKKLCFSFDNYCFFSCGIDGSIFSYIYNPEEEYPETTATLGTGMPYTSVEDVEDESYPTLEEIKQKEQYDIKMEIAEKQKNEVKGQLAQLAKQFEAILQRNNALHESQRLTESELEVDPRVTADLTASIDSEMALMERKLAHEVEKSRLGLAKVKSYFLDNLSSVETHVLACRSNVKVTTFRQRVLNEEYHDMKEEVMKKIEIERLKSRPREPEATGPPTEEPVAKKVSPFEMFLKGLPLNSLEYKLNLKLQRLLEKYYARKQKKEKRQAEWEELNQKKPDPNVDHIDDIIAFNDAVKTIGDYKLKTSKDYRVPQHLRVTTVRKLKECMDTREKIYFLKDNFNKKVFALRDKKVQMIKELKEMTHKLEAIKNEIGDVSDDLIPEIPDVNENLEFPEKIYELREEDILTINGEEKSDEGPEGNSVHGTSDVELEVLGSSIPDKEQMTRHCDVPLETMTMLYEEDVKKTPWEMELEKQRRARLALEQGFLLKKMEQMMTDFDREVLELNNMKVVVEMHAKLKELHLLKLDLELEIVKDFEDKENDISDILANKTEEYRDMQIKIKELESKLEKRKKNVEELFKEEQIIHATFNQSVAESVFIDFLRKIYKKKYRPPKVATDDEEDDEESTTDESTTDDDMDYVSGESGDFIPIKLDESVCPPGCDEQLYQQTFELRSQRHKIEQEIQEEKKNVEGLRKELDTAQKKEKSMLESINVTREDLETLQCEKQLKLNEVDCLVILHLDQMQHLKVAGGVEKLCDSLVFSQQALKQMESRVSELHHDTEKQDARYKTNKKHLFRMKIDCKQMANDIAQLKEHIKECMIRKFGQEISVDDLEEAMLRKLIAEMGSSLAELQKEYDIKIAKLKEIQREKAVQLFQAVQENTEKLNLLTILEEEKRHLAKLLKAQVHRKENPPKDIEEEYRWEVQKLSEIASTQAKRIVQLQKEIKKLGMKSQPPCVCTPPLTPGTPPKDDSVITEATADSDKESNAEDVRKYLHDLINDFANYTRKES